MLKTLARLVWPLVLSCVAVCAVMIVLGSSSATTPTLLAASPAEPNAPGACLTTTWTYLTQTATTNRFRIHYTLDSVNHPKDALSSSLQPDLLGTDLEDAYDAYVGYGFKAPTLNSDGYIEVYIYALGAFGKTSSNWDCIVISPGRVRTSATAIRLGTPHHELFHRVQNEYATGTSDWMQEGTAKMMEDQVFTDTDTDPNSEYLGRVALYLGDPSQTTFDNKGNATSGGLLQASYNAALFWKYFSRAVWHVACHRTGLSVQCDGEVVGGYSDS